jgi:glutamyl-tRNA reductase
MLAAIKKVHLYNTDDLKGIANQNLQNRQKEFGLCREIIRSEVQKFALKTLQSNLEPANA